MRALFPGSFDPITNGHIDIIERGAKMFDELWIGIMVNPDKRSLFTVEERIEMIRESVKHLANVQVIHSSKLTVDYAREHDIRVLIRGLRAVMDYEYELQQASANMMLDEKIESCFLVASPEHSFISSSTVKTIAAHHGSLKGMVPLNVAQALKARYPE